MYLQPILDFNGIHLPLLYSNSKSLFWVNKLELSVDCTFTYTKSTNDLKITTPESTFLRQKSLV